MRGDKEPRRDDRDGLVARFTTAVASLAGGELTFPAPFDLGSSAALAANDDCGSLAVEVFNLAAQRDSGFKVSIAEVTGGISREVIDTSTPTTGTLIALLEGLLEELYAKHGIE